jgi:hypothetical protein
MERTIVIEYSVGGREQLERKEFHAKPTDKVGYRIDSDGEHGCLVVFVNSKTFIVPLVNLALLEMNL